MSGFLEEAVRIFETAAAAPPEAGPADLGLLIDGAGALRIVDANGWRAAALETHYGARTVYRVTRHAGGVEVSGRSHGLSCVLQSEKPAGARHLSGAIPGYTVVPCGGATPAAASPASGSTSPWRTPAITA